MKKIAILLSLACLALSCGGGGSSSIPQADACGDAAKAACEKIFACGAAFQAQLTSAFGTEAQCETMFVTSCSAGSTGFTCAATQTYHGDQAGMCRDQFNNLSCTTLTTAVLPLFLGTGGTLSSAFTTIAAMLPPCNQICTTP